MYHISKSSHPIFDFTTLDLVVDTMLQNNCKPIIDLGFMPDDLSAGPKRRTSYFYPQNELYKYPPKDYPQWEALVYETVQHFVEKPSAAKLQKKFNHHGHKEFTKFTKKKN